jgi:hypothetical protein
MTSPFSDEPLRVVRVECEQRTFPPYDAFHGTPAPMLWRRLTVETPKGAAVFEQSDYGHPGRMNPWEPRDVAPSLLQSLPELSAIAEAVGMLVV